VGEIERTMSVKELQRWRVFTVTHPLPADLLDTHCSMLAHIIANIARSPSQQAYRPEQFFLIRQRPSEHPLVETAVTGEQLDQAARFMIKMGLR